MFKFSNYWRRIFHRRFQKNTDELKADSAQFSNAVGTCLDNSFRLTFLQADFECIASAQAIAFEDAATQMGSLVDNRHWALPRVGEMRKRLRLLLRGIDQSTKNCESS